MVVRCWCFSFVFVYGVDLPVSFLVIALAFIDFVTILGSEEEVGTYWLSF